MTDRLRVRAYPGRSPYATRLLELVAGEERVELVSAGAADVLLALDGRPRFRPGARTVTLIESVGHLVARRAYGPLEWLRENWRTASAARRSDHLLTPSTAVAAGLERHLGVRAERVSALPLPPRLRRARREEVEELRARLGLPDRYLVLAGGRSSLKLPDLGLPLLPEPPAEAPELAALLSGALAWLNPSAYAGDALGALEAMACGAPPVVAATGALPYAVGAAGMILDPADPDAWREAVDTLAADAELRARLVANGLKAVAEVRAAGTPRSALWAALQG